jgi:GT2 family glycosyltransferase
MIPKAICSIIIVSFNNFDTTTGPCLKSLLQDKTAMEIIVVDNDSDKHTLSQLKHIAQTDSRIKLHFNESNRGYAGGNNDGVLWAVTDTVILLNNDTIVPAGAIKKLADLLKIHPNWDMIGPVTNSCGNEQQLHTAGSDVEKVLDQGDRWCRHSNNFCFHTDLLGFFCIAMRKTAYQNLSGLDEDFGLGFYEDTDFCHRAHQSGMEMIITEDVFVYHQGSATFSKLPDQTKKLMKANRMLFKRKHGIYPGTLHVREKNLHVLKMYRSALENQGANKGIYYKAANRLQIAERLQPNSLIKRFFYKKKLRPLQQYFNNTYTA